MGVRLIADDFSIERDAKGAPDVVIINQAMAQTFWPGQDPIGHRIRTGGSTIAVGAR